MKYRSIDCQPIFLIGAARSGTKFVRDLLAADSRVQEIPFDVNFLWRRGNEPFPHDGLPAHLATQSIVDNLRNRLTRIAKVNNGQILLEKTVSNALRLPFVQAVFPEAKYIHLIRDGRSVVESVHRVWDRPTTLSYKLKKLRYFPISDFRYGWWFVANSRKSPARVWGPRYEGIDQDLASRSRLEVCGLQWLHCVDAATRDLKEIDDDRKIEVRYEDLVHDRDTLQRLVDFTSAADPSAIIARYNSVLSRENIDKWRGCWDENQKDSLQRLIGHRLSQLGYGEVVDNPTVKKSDVK